jgi:glycosyltransferase involved in cell wall biosynthesis
MAASLDPDVVYVHEMNNYPLVLELAQRWPVLRHIHIDFTCASGGARFLRRTRRPCCRTVGPACLWHHYVDRCRPGWDPRWSLWSYRRATEAVKAWRQLPKLLVASEFVRESLLKAGFDAEQVEVLPYFVPDVEAVPVRDGPPREFPGGGGTFQTRRPQACLPDVGTAAGVETGPGPDLGGGFPGGLGEGKAPWAISAGALVPRGVPPPPGNSRSPHDTRATTRTRTAEASGVPEVLFVGRIMPEKGLYDLLRALAGLKREYRLVVVGDGPARANAERLAASLGILPRVTFAGWQGEVAPFYRRASLLVVPSLWPEPFGIIGIEAMAHALPVVAYRSGGIPEWLVDGVTGRLVEPGDVAGLAVAIDEVLGDAALARKLGEAGRKRQREMFGPERHIEKLEKVFAKVAAAGRDLG